jgi:hypothetical protein
MGNLTGFLWICGALSGFCDKSDGVGSAVFAVISLVEAKECRSGLGGLGMRSETSKWITVFLQASKVPKPSTSKKNDSSLIESTASYQKTVKWLRKSNERKPKRTKPQLLQLALHSISATTNCDRSTTLTTLLALLLHGQFTPRWIDLHKTPNIFNFYAIWPRNTAEAIHSHKNVPKLSIWIFINLHKLWLRSVKSALDFVHLRSYFISLFVSPSINNSPEIAQQPANKCKRLAE